MKSVKIPFLSKKVIIELKECEMIKIKVKKYPERR